MKIKMICIFPILLLITSIAFARGSIKSERDQLNDKFRDIEKKMEKLYEDKKFDGVINLYEKNCLKDDKAEAGKETMEFKRVQKGIRADIYKWVALSNFKKNKPEKVETYLRKLHGSKAQLNNVLRTIEKKMQGDYDNRKFKEVTNLYDKYFHEAKAGKEVLESKTVKKDVRANIYQWVALSNFKLKKHEEVEIYLKKLRRREAQLNEVYRNITEEMKEFYEDGKLTEVIDRYKLYCRKDDKKKALKEKKGFKRVDEDIRADIYRLVALSYDDLDETVKRDNYLKKILDIELHLDSGIYRPSWRKMAEEKYFVTPRLLLGLNLGANITMPHIDKRYSIPDSAGSIKWYSYHNYSYKLTHIYGSQVAVIVEYALTKNLSVRIQPAFLSMRFRYENSFPWEGDRAITMTYTHRHKFYYIDVPLLLKYRFVNIKWKLKLYVQAGGFLRFLSFAHKTIDVDNTIDIDSVLEEGSLLYPEKKTISFNLKKPIARVGSGLWVGAGIGYDTELMGLIFRMEVEANYKHRFTDIVDGRQRYDDKEIIGGYYDVFDDIKTKNFGISFNLLVSMRRKTFRR